MAGKSGHQSAIFVADLIELLERINLSLGLSVQVEPEDPNALSLVDQKGETVAVVDFIEKRVNWLNGRKAKA